VLANEISMRLTVAGVDGHRPLALAKLCTIIPTENPSAILFDAFGEQATDSMRRYSRISA
jgi:hypothetical protein